jgi:hypothetical protein
LEPGTDLTEASKELIKRKLDPRHEGLIRPYCLEWKFGRATAYDFYRVKVATWLLWLGIAAYL